MISLENLNCVHNHIDFRSTPDTASMTIVDVLNGGLFDLGNIRHMVSSHTIATLVHSNSMLCNKHKNMTSLPKNRKLYWKGKNMTKKKPRHFLIVLERKTTV